MNKLRLLAAFTLAAPLMHGYAPHPSILTVSYHDQMHKVVKVINTDPIIIVDGKEKRIRTEPLYLMQRAETFNFQDQVDLVRASLGGTRLSMVANKEDEADTSPREAPRFGTTYFEATLKSKRLLQGGFIAVVAYTDNSFDPSASNYNPPQIIVHDLPDLPAGDPTTVKFSSAAMQLDGHATYFIQVFDAQGVEVSAANLDSPAKYYARLERMKLQGAIQRYTAKYAGADHPAAPVMMAQPVFPAGLAAPKGAVSAVLTVAADGTVTEVQVRGVEDAAARKGISDALGGWLFLPQLKAGAPVPTRIQVPLQF